MLRFGPFRQNCFPRSLDRGFIEADVIVMSGLPVNGFPRSLDRVFIEASLSRRLAIADQSFPRSLDRGFIEARGRAARRDGSEPFRDH